MLAAAKAFGFVHVQPGDETFFARQGTRYRIDFTGEGRRSVWFDTPQFTEAPAIVITIPAVPLSGAGAGVE